MTRGALAVAIALLLPACSDVSAPSVSRVTFDRHSATLWAGDILATSVSVSRTDGEVVASALVTYSSSNPVVASVDSVGTIRAHAAGQVTISAAVGSIKDTLDVTVLWPPVKVVVFSDDSLVMSVGDTAAPPVIVLDSRGNWATHATLTFSSSDSSIATAQTSIVPGCPVATCSFEGRIAAVREGRTIVTVTAGGISDFLPVIVTK